MKEVKFLVPTMAELDKMSPEEMQQKMMSSESAAKLAEEGVAIYFVTDSLSFAPDGKTAVFSVYVVLGNEEDVKNSLKYYYPSQ